MIIQQCRRYDLLIRMLSALQFHCRIHIYHQLQLQAVVQCRQVEFLIAGLVIDDLDIDMLRVLRYIDTVNASLQVHLLFFRQIHMNTVQILREPEGQLIIVRLKASLLQMLLQGQHRPGQDPAHPGNSIFIPRRTVQNGLPISRSITFHCFFDGLSCKIFIKIPPCSTGFCKFSCEILQYRMVHISHIRHFKAKFFSLLQRQAILQEMSACAGSIGL